MNIDYKKKDKQNGFTLIETLIAVAVLMIAIAGPLTVSNKALTTSLYARDQSTASYLAQEEVELIKNYKDNHINFNPWLGNMSSCTSGSKCDIDPSGNIKSCSTLSMGCQLYLQSDGTYTNSNTGSPTIFSRYFTLIPVNNNNDLSNTELSGYDGIAGQSTPREYQINAVVSWKTGSISNSVTLHGEITDATLQ